MREIKFRGIPVGQTEFIYGDLVTSGKSTFILIPEAQHFDDVTEVDPATVGQFTGLKDMNGTDIYEGDIMKDGATTYEVIHNERNASFCLKHAFYYSYFDDDVQIYNVHVIGNVHQHPELIKP